MLRTFSRLHIICSNFVNTKNFNHSCIYRQRIAICEEFSRLFSNSVTRGGEPVQNFWSFRGKSGEKGLSWHPDGTLFHSVSSCSINSPRRSRKSYAAWSTLRGFEPSAGPMNP